MRVPNYCIHKRSGRGIIRWKPFFGKSPYYLKGVYGSKESRAEYEQIRAKIVASLLAEHPQQKPPKGKATLSAMFDAFLDHAKVYYHANAKEYGHFRTLAKVLNENFGPELLAAEFGPLALKKAREAMVIKGWSRSHVNHQVERIKRSFKWGVENELVEVTVLAALREVAGLRRGKTDAKESKRVEGVPWDIASRVLPFVSPTIAAMIEVQFLAGMRSGELCSMTPAEVERQAGVWIYSPALHKNAWREKPRIIVLGPRAIELCSRYLPLEPNVAFFRPSEALRELAERRSAARKTPHTPSSQARKSKTRSCNPTYNSHSYWLALRHGFIAMARSGGAKRKESPPKGKGTFSPWLEKHGVQHWHPHQLRHARATLTRDAYGDEGAEAILGDTPEAAKRYGQRSLVLALRIAGEQG